MNDTSRARESVRTLKGPAIRVSPGRCEPTKLLADQGLRFV